LFTHEGLSSWSHPSKKLCLIGDAAHAMTPYLAQGAAMGIEDGAILGGLLEKFPTKETLPKVLRLYEELRIGRTAMVASNSIDSRWFTQMEDGPEQEKRDAYLLSHPGIWEGHINIRSRKEFLDELFEYDAYAALEKATRS
jgi:salicylate hydroxylase